MIGKGGRNRNQHQGGGIFAMAPAILLSALVMAGCSKTTVIKRDEPFRLDRQAMLTSRDSVSIRIAEAWISGEHLNFRENPEGREMSMPVAGVRDITVTNRGKGVAQGAWIGLLAGIPLGWLNARATTDPEDCSGCFGTTPSQEAAVGMFFMSVAIGGTLGGLIGNRELYVFDTKASAAADTADSSLEAKGTPDREEDFPPAGSP